MNGYIFITKEFDPYALADRLQDAGKKVVIGVVPEENINPDHKKVGEQMYEGILETQPVEQVMKWMKDLPKKDDWFFMADYGDLWPYSERALDMGFTKGIFPTEEGYKLEEDRQAGKAFAKKHYPNLKVAPVHEFKNVDDALEFLENEPDKIFVLKSEGSNAETVLPMTTDPELARKQISGALRTESQDYEKGGFTLEERLKHPIELSPVMLFWDGKPLFSLVELENKPLGSGNIGRLTGGCQNLTIQTRLDCPLNKIAFPPIVYEMAKKQPGIGIYDAGLLYDGRDFYFSEWCFDTETELLTSRGWLRYTDVNVGDETLSLNPVTKEMQWKPITRKIVRAYDGPMVELKNKTSFDALVTPEHKFLVTRDKKRQGPLSLCRADRLPVGSDIPRTGKWVGEYSAEIVIPKSEVFFEAAKCKKGEWSKGGEYIVVDFDRKRFIHHTLPELRIKTKAFCYLLGIWLAEGNFGHCHKGVPRTISIAQSNKSKKRSEIQSNLDRVGLPYRISKNGNFHFHDVRLARYLWNDLGLAGVHSDTKFIPFFFKNLDKECLHELVNGYLAGDGNWHRSQWACGTVSKRLAGDLQEVFHKLGWVSNIRFRNVKGSRMVVNGKEHFRRHDCYWLTTRHEKTGFQIKRGNRKLVPYSGLVWDVEVADNHSLFVRRNGRAFFSSNCSQRWGWDGVFSEIEMSGDSQHKNACVNHFDLIAQGKNPLRWPFGASVRMFQLEPDDKRPCVFQDGYSVDWLNEVSNQLYFYCIRKEKQDDFRSVGYRKDFGVATGSGMTMEESVDMAYRTAQGVAMTGLYYRPKFDFMNRTYLASIANRWDFLKNSGLI